MKKYRIYLLVAAFLLLASFTYFYYFGINRAQAIEIIGKGKNFPDGWDSGFKDDYLIARAKAIRLLSKTFTLNGIKYDTLTGRVTL